MGQQQAKESEECSPESDRPLPEEPFECDVLSTYQCPFQSDHSPPFCSFIPACPFGHHETCSICPQSATLHPVPWFLCLDRLLSQCTSNQVERITESLFRCENGLHPSVEQLTDPEALAQQLAISVLNSHTSKLTLKAPKCGKCTQSLLPDSACGLLENCTHRLCFCCVESWRSKPSEQEPKFLSIITCQICGTASYRILIWPEPVCSRAYQAFLFAKLKSGFGMLLSPGTDASIHEGYSSFRLTFKGRTYKCRLSVPWNAYQRPRVPGKRQAQGITAGKGKTTTGGGTNGAKTNA